MELKNKVFMFTGRIRVTRHEAQDIVESLSGVAGSYLNHQTDYLVVGEDPGDKLRRGTEYGTTILSEEDFWRLVESEKAMVPACAAHVDKWQPEVKNYPPADEVSYGNMDILQRLLQENPSVSIVLGPHECTHCSTVIPYTIDRNYWYCFHCEKYSRPGIKGWHTCSDWIEIEDIPVAGGIYQKCELCKNVRFVETDELVEMDRKRRLRNFVHSLEWHIAILQQLQTVQAAHGDSVRNYETYNPEVHAETVAAWVNKQNVRTARKEERHQARYERRLLNRGLKT